jgi:uncharacterized Zn finger protein
MIELKSKETLANAIAHARAGRLFVQPTDRFRQYTVTNRQTGAQYNVQFLVSAGRRFATCTCKAGLNAQACKHVAGAAALHLHLAARQAEPQRQASEPVLVARQPQGTTFRGIRL